jgi:glycerol uptake facilitator protein
MVLAGRMKPRLLPGYWLAQLLGAFVAGSLSLLLFHHQIGQYEALHEIIRGNASSVQTAMMFGEYFPNPLNSHPLLGVSFGTAMLAEGLGTFLLATMIFILTEGCNVGRPSEGVSPILIGGTVAAIISIFAPLTQAGINPARDLGPRLVAYLAGWGTVAIPGPEGGFFCVYILSPLLGGMVAALLFRFVIEPCMKRNTNPSEACRPYCKTPESVG